MKHARGLVSPAEALRLVFLPILNIHRNASLLPIKSYLQQRSASSSFEASPITYRPYRPSGTAPPRISVPRADDEHRTYDRSRQSFGPQNPRSFGPRGDGNGRPRENNGGSSGGPLPRSFGPRADSSGRAREDSDHPQGTALFRTFRPRSEPESRPNESGSRPREPGARTFGVSPPRTFGPRSLRDGPPRDEAIRSLTVRIVSADNKIQEPSYLPDVLASIDRKTHFVQQVSRPDDPNIPIPVCKIIDKKESREQERARAKAVKSSQHAASAKKLELSWGIGKHDLEHRMNKVREFLEEGRRVEIVVGASRRKGQAKKAARIEAQEAAETFRTIREAVAGIEDVAEWKPMVGTVGTMATLYLEAKTKKVKGNKAEKDEDSVD
ncbi:hypothetical protein MMC34_000262 [Xylographa carneopallida]|nr:hypothetical protein [Xylographa carneopallida]